MRTLLPAFLLWPALVIGQTGDGPPPDLPGVIAAVRENALNYTRSLPDYLCRQVTKRRVDPNGSGAWRETDTIVEQLSFFGQKESYRVLLVNNSAAPAGIEHDQVGGSTSSGEFGSILRAILAPESETDLTWEHWETLRGRRQFAFAFRARRPVYTIRHAASGRTIVARVKGHLWIDPDLRLVTRIQLECDGIPGDFPIRAVTLDQDYDFAEIGGRKYLLPLHSDVRSREAHYQSWNEVTFSAYRKFGADASVSYDAGDAGKK